jgi:hypothetical protein
MLDPTAGLQDIAFHELPGRKDAGDRQIQMPPARIAPVPHHRRARPTIEPTNGMKLISPATDPIRNPKFSPTRDSDTA